MEISDRSALAKGFATFLLLILLAGCGTVTVPATEIERYLQSTTTHFSRLVSNWAKLKKLPNQERCLSIENELNTTETELKKLTPPESAKNIHELFLEILALQRKELKTQREMSSLAEYVKKGNLTKAEVNEDFQRLFGESRANAEEMLELNHKLNAALEKIEKG